MERISHKLNAEMRLLLDVGSESPICFKLWMPLHGRERERDVGVD